MKKFLLIIGFTMLLFTSCIPVTVKAQTGATIIWPFGAVSVPTALSPTTGPDTLKAVINNVTYVTFSDTLHTALTVVVVPSAELRKGAVMFIKISWGVIIRTVTFSTGFTSKTQTGTASKTTLCEFWYDGSKFLNVSNNLLN